MRFVYYNFSNCSLLHKGFYELIGKIVYTHKGFECEWITKKEIKKPKDFNGNYREVIGNIYENPELLNKKED